MPESRICSNEPFHKLLADGRVSLFHPRKERLQISFFSFPDLLHAESEYGECLLGVPEVVWWGSLNAQGQNRYGLAVRTPEGEWKGYYEPHNDILELSYVELSDIGVTSVFRLMIHGSEPSILLLSGEVGSLFDLVIVKEAKPPQRERRVIQLEERR